MSLIVLGVSHRTAPVPMLERLSLPADGVAKLLRDVTDASAVAESMVLSTCNRIELYVEADQFHPAVDAVTERLSRHTGVDHQELVPHLYVHYEDRAVQHAFAVAAGLDSMVVGESQILGQVRGAFRGAQTAGTVGRSLNELVQNALRVGKRAHAETGIDAAGASLVAVGLQLAARSLEGLADRAAVVVGAGSMASLAAQSLQRLGVAVTVVNRTPERGARLAEQVGGRAVPFAELAAELAGADLLVACTGSLGHVVPTDVVRQAQQGRHARPLVLLDLALPRDIDPEVLGVPGVTLVDLEDLGDVLSDGEYEQDVEGVRRIVADEVDAFLDARHTDRVAPTVVALRDRAREIIDAELAWFDAHRGDLDERSRADVERLLQRVVDKLLHAPTVRVKELAAGPDGDAYAEALHRLFDLDLRTIEALRTPDPEDGPR
ncbi:MAG TPA: glutamyl-tRNA reductase [Actinomycetes bacterium]|nr:glutamyl-tRNA reductase [Actinomycetes bacterium]